MSSAKSSTEATVSFPLEGVEVPQSRMWRQRGPEAPTRATANPLEQAQGSAPAEQLDGRRRARNVARGANVTFSEATENVRNNQKPLVTKRSSAFRFKDTIREQPQEPMEPEPLESTPHKGESPTTVKRASAPAKPLTLVQLLKPDGQLQRSAYEAFDAYVSMRNRMLAADVAARSESLSEDIFMDRCKRNKVLLANNVVQRTWIRPADLRQRTIRYAFDAKDFVYDWYLDELQRIAKLVEMSQRLRREVVLASKCLSRNLLERMLINVLDSLWHAFLTSKKAARELQERWEDIAAELREEVEMLVLILVMAEKQAAYGCSEELDLYCEGIELLLQRKLNVAAGVHTKVVAMQSITAKYLASSYVNLLRRASEGAVPQDKLAQSSAAVNRVYGSSTVE